MGDGFNEGEQLKASKGTLFIPFSQFPPKRMRSDCLYYDTPAMVTPKCLENVDSCEVKNYFHSISETHWSRVLIHVLSLNQSIQGFVHSELFENKTQLKENASMFCLTDTIIL